ncbi:ExeA family protein [Marinibactrum halimedae]|uniref:MSHA biogenesis protein MshM n=1 Tax=Marinibactrum halimedae TaxID=1444977 RepID=A0AA37TCI5_9GAMM|nr:AAA family ATPase [Marinibactrum halimedae]MCD9460823.1 AAA family ATPase [Marinibactrum halimedae]GLS26712.1 MSHA biogenesis protein MshM [Marinibactrum halimedae]
MTLHHHLYEPHFGLKRAPFSLTPDTEFFCEESGHGAVLNATLLALEHGEGFIKIVGEVGTGKTLLCRQLLKRLQQGFVTAYIPNPYLSPEGLNSAVAEELQMPSDTTLSSHQLLKALNLHLIKLAQSEKRVVLVIDEAQAMPKETLEALRLMTNLETEHRKLLQVVLFGQPELDQILSRNDLRQLRQRIVFSEYLYPLNRSQSQHYVNTRLQVAGFESSTLFTKGAFWWLYHYSGGIPRLMNILCHKALLSAYGLGVATVSSREMRRAIHDTPEARLSGLNNAWQKWALWGALSGGGVLLVWRAARAGVGL